MKWDVEIDEEKLNYKGETIKALDPSMLYIQGEAKQSRYILVL